jgi:hypothetical protein
MTLTEAFIAAQTEVLRQILQTQQQIAQRLQQPVHNHGPNPEGPNAVMSYEKFRAMRPPLFTKEKEPLEADAFIRALEAMFSIFTLSCSEENKAVFAAQQLRGEALIWWEHFKCSHRVTRLLGQNLRKLSKSIIFLRGLLIEK